ncbi:MAG TPA: patatin-like phospholipase family protein [Bacteroidales bacterium]|nr:patatin-like phospholipase family protein [Bacteroidales bacterium]
MKKSVAAFIPVALVAVLIIILSRSDKKTQAIISPEPRSGVAVILTGAAARIPQEAALLEELDKKGLLKDLVFISGVSSGALNSVLLNGILSGRMTWDEYKNILYNLKNSDVFVQEGKKFPVNTSPARELYKRIVEEDLGYYMIGDLPYTTALSVTHPEDLYLKRTIYRMCSRKINEETDTTLNLVDILMASTSFPVIFPAVRIENVKTIPDVEFIDGGAGEDMVPYQALFEFEKHRGAGVEKIYIVSHKMDSTPEISEELRGLGIDDRGLFDRLGVSLDAIISKGIMKRLEAYVAGAPDHISRTYIFIPDFQTDFLLFNFENLKLQYDLASEWAQKHEPVPLSDFMLQLQAKNN